MQAMVKAKDMKGRDAVWFLVENHQYELLDSVEMNEVVNNLWYGNRDVTGSLFEASSSFRLLDKSDRSKSLALGDG